MNHCQMCGREIPEGQQLCPTCRNAWEWRQRQAQTAGQEQSRPESPPGRPEKAAPGPKASKAAPEGRLLALAMGVLLALFLLFFAAAVLLGGGKAAGEPSGQLTAWDGAGPESGQTDAGPETVEITAPSDGLPTQQPTQPEQGGETEPEAGSEEYVLPGSDSAYLSREVIAALTPEQLRLARNEIYARHGRIFQDEALAAYFGSKSWYQPLYDAESFDALGDSILNEYEIANRDLIREYEALYSGQ